MQLTANFEHEREELASLLGSGMFSRAPSLAQLLTYICERYFDGEAGQIKEYNIAVEALGRPPDFDQKRDSIVRVEAHRLRKRLKDYYAGAGSGRTVRIEIPSGQYAPKFLISDAAAATPVDPLPVSLPEIPEEARFEYPALPDKPAHSRSWLLMGLGFVLLIGVSIVVAMRTTHASARVQAQPSALFVPDQPAPRGATLRILAGSSRPYTDHEGVLWQADRYFAGGTAAATLNQPVFGTRDPIIYQNRRDGPFRYNIPLKPGAYELRLHFAETLYGESNAGGGGETSRLFNVNSNGKTLLEAVDIIADAGPNQANIRVFKDIYPAADGILHLEFIPVVSHPFLNALEITPGTPGRLRPIRIVTQDRTYTDKHGRVWMPDRYFRGGQIVYRKNLVAGASDPELYRAERFGNLMYAIPVAPGRYTLIVHFAETWFGPGSAQRGGEGSRVFDLLFNGVALVRAMDIYKQAGGAGRALERTFHGLEPNPQGKLVISFVPVRNYACLNAIEVLDEAE